MGDMRWERLFDDLEAQLASDEAHDREAEIADRTRRERALIDLHARLLANVGARARLVGRRSGAHGASSSTSGPTGCSSSPLRAGPCCCGSSAVRSVSGLRRGAQTPSVVARRFTLGLALGGDQP